MDNYYILKAFLTGLLIILPGIIAYFKTKSVKPSILSSYLFSLGFNIAIHFVSDNSYVGGTLSYYKIPTIHLLDITSLLLLLYITFNKKLKPPNIVFIASLLILTGVYGGLPGISYIFKYLLYATTAVSIVNFYDRKELLKALSYGLIPALALNLPIALYQVIFSHSIGINILGEPVIHQGAIDIAAIRLGDLFIVRGYGFQLHPNVLAGISLFGLLTFDFFSKSTRKFNLAAIICSVLILLTFSKAAIFVLALYWAYKLLPIKLHKYILPISLLLATTTIGYGVYQSNEFITIRVAQLGTAIDYFIDAFPRSLLGTGITGFLDALAQEPIRLSTGTYFIQPLHNIFALILFEYGVFGIGWGVLLWQFLRHNLNRSNHCANRILAVLFMVGVGAVDHYFLTIPAGIAIFILLLTFYSTPKYSCSSERH